MDKYNKHRFRLISPIVGNKLYSSSSIKHVAKKCMTELKNNIQYSGKKYTKFAILDIDNYTTYKFSINYHQKTHNHNLPLNGPLFGGNELIDKIASLEERLNKLENNKDNNKNNSLNDKDNSLNDKDKLFNNKNNSFNNKDNSFNNKDNSFNNKDNSFNDSINNKINNGGIKSISNYSAYEKKNNKTFSEQPYMS